MKRFVRLMMLIIFMMFGISSPLIHFTPPLFYAIIQIQLNNLFGVQPRVLKPNRLSLFRTLFYYIASMIKSKTILMSILVTSLLAVTGCTTQTATNTNAVTNTIVNSNAVNQNSNTEVATNTNEMIVSDNTNTESVSDGNTEQGSEIDSTNWLTYANEEYGFSVKYPSNYSFSESHEGVNFINLESDSSVANQENIKFYVQSYSEAPDKQGEAYALLSTKSELSSLKNEMIQNADKIVNGEPVNIYNGYDVPGDAFYRGASFFANQDYVRVSMVIMPTDIIHPSHPFNGETREWAEQITQQLNEGQLISENDEVRIQIFNDMINTLKVL